MSGELHSTLKTASDSSFYFTFHYGDLSNTFVCGPSGASETKLPNLCSHSSTSTILILCSSTRIVAAPPAARKLQSNRLRA
jgi:hypothetical protein